MIPKKHQKIYTKATKCRYVDMNKEIFDSLNCERDIRVKTIIPSQNTAFRCTPALSAVEIAKSAVTSREVVII